MKVGREATFIIGIVLCLVIVFLCTVGYFSEEKELDATIGNYL